MNRCSAAAAASEMDIARRFLGIAEKQLIVRDFVGSKKFAELALESNPLLDGVDWIIAASDVLLAAERPRINYHIGWYEILQIGDSKDDRAISALRRQYRRLALLLRPDSRPHSTVADEALKMVENAWKVLSDPMKKDLYDKELLIAASAEQATNGGATAPPQEEPGTSGGAASEAVEEPADTSFWTVCTNCFYLHQYAREWEGKTLMCQSCKKSFLARELQSLPPMVPGSDLYYCVWGLFPLGFPGDVNPSAGSTPWNSPSISPFFPGFQPRPPAADQTGARAEAEKNLKRSFAAMDANGDISNAQKNPGQNQKHNQTFPATQCSNDLEKPCGETRKKAMVIRPRKHSAVGDALPAKEAESGVLPKDKDEEEKDVDWPTLLEKTFSFP